LIILIILEALQLQEIKTGLTINLAELEASWSGNIILPYQSISPPFTVKFFETIKI
jgi:hypothetical protein